VAHHLSLTSRSMIGGAAIVLLAVAASACEAQPAGHRGSNRTALQAEATRRGPVITIDSGLGETFTLTPARHPALTASQAWARFARFGNNRMPKAIPARVRPRLGLFTLPAGPADAPGTSMLTKKNGEAYTALNELTWGYSWHECGPVMPPVPLPGSTPAPAPSPSPDHCTEWLFLDANTAAQIVQTTQQQ
jgi:hypothetical protein